MEKSIIKTNQHEIPYTLDNEKLCHIPKMLPWMASVHLKLAYRYIQVFASYRMLLR